MTTSKKAVKDIEGNGHPMPDSPSGRRRKSGRRGKSQTQPHPKSADHATVADRIMSRLDEIDSRVEQLIIAQAGHPTASTESECLDQLAAEISSSTGALAQQVSDGLNHQNQAIAGIASDLSGFQATLTRLFAEFTTRTTDEKPSDLLAGNQDHTRLVAQRGTCSPTDESDASSGNAWEQIKNAFLMEEDFGCGDDAEVSSETSAPAVPDCDVETAAADEPAHIDPPFEIPELLDIDSLSDADLRPALVEREGLMSTLVQRLLRKVRSTQTLSAEQLDELKGGLPEELAERVEQSLRPLSQQERLGQLELCLERAQVSRQLSTLDETRQKLEATARGLGLTISENGFLEGEIDAVKKRGSKGRRWVGALGFGN